MEKKEPKFTPVKDYAINKGTTVQAVYQKAKRGGLLIKKIGSYTLVADKA